MYTTFSLVENRFVVLVQHLHQNFTIRLFACLFIFSSAPVIAQTPQDAALIDAASMMNFIDWYRDATNGTYVYGGTVNDAPDTFFDDIPYFEVNDYAYFQGTYSGKTWNRTGNKYGDTWITLGNVDYDQGTICVKADWNNGLVGSVHLEAGINYTNIFTGEGYLYYQGQARYSIQMFLFLYGDYKTLKGACILTPLTPEGHMQCSTFTVWK